MQTQMYRASSLYEDFLLVSGRIDDVPTPVAHANRLTNLAVVVGQGNLLLRAAVAKYSTTIPAMMLSSLEFGKTLNGYNNIEYIYLAPRDAKLTIATFAL